MSANTKKINSTLSIPIYLDYSSTTPVDKRVADKMSECLTLDGAPSSVRHSDILSATRLSTGVVDE